MKKMLFVLPVFLIGCQMPMNMSSFQPAPTRVNVVSIMTEDNRLIQIEGQISNIMVKDKETVLLDCPHDSSKKSDKKFLCVNDKRAFQVVLQDKVSGQRTEMKMIAVPVKE